MSRAASVRSDSISFQRHRVMLLPINETVETQRAARVEQEVDPDKQHVKGRSSLMRRLSEFDAEAQIAPTVAAKAWGWDL